MEWKCFMLDEWLTSLGGFIRGVWTFGFSVTEPALRNIGHMVIAQKLTDITHNRLWWTWKVEENKCAMRWNGCTASMGSNNVIILLLLCYYTVITMLCDNMPRRTVKQIESRCKRENYHILLNVIWLLFLSNTFQIYSQHVTLCKHEGIGCAFL